MNRRPRVYIQLAVWVILLLLMLWIPEFGVFVLIGMASMYLYKRIRHVPAATFIKKRR